MATVLEAVKKALPAAPTGWVILGDEAFSVPASICQDYERSPWDYHFTRYYQRVDDQEARDKVIKDAAADAMADLKQKQPRIDAIMAKLKKLSEEQVAAVQKNDMARAQAINHDLAAVQEEYKKVFEEGDSSQKMEAAAAEAGRDLQMTISLPRPARSDRELH